MSSLTLLQTSFRDAMAAVCTPVSVVTTVVDGRPRGTTVSAFASLSLSPPMVLISLNSTSSLLAAVRETGRVGLNVLAVDQAGLAQKFASRSEQRFVGVDWTEESGAVRLDGVAAWVACSVSAILPGGDHEIVLGEVVEVATQTASPLTYHDRTFGTHRRP
jgi:flavin reductase (DIM6/NTAB) family NADH-FMN oxidoreductase RutF